MLKPEQLAELLRRSAGGEAVRAVLASWGMDNDEELVWLQKNAHQDLVTAKRAFREKQVEFHRALDFKAMVANVEAVNDAVAETPKDAG